jgi:hypothetical protein
MWTVVNWWESRRAVFNLTVGAAGVLSLLLVNAFALLPPHPAILRVPPLAILVYAVMANLCYTLGPIVDVAIHRRWGPTYAAIGPTIFRYGFVFSLGLTLLPIPLAVLSWVVRWFV